MVVGAVVKRCIVGLFVACVLSLSVAVFDAVPAGACDYDRPSDADAFARADAVFVGSVIGYESPTRPISSSVDPAIWTFAVRQVYKGEVSRNQQIVSELMSVSCGLDIPKSGEFLVFASTRTSGPSPTPAAGQYYAGMCGGTRTLSEGVLEPGLATPHAPVQVAGVVPRAPARAEADRSSRDARAIGIIGAAVVASLGLGLVLLALRRQRSRGGPA